MKLHNYRLVCKTAYLEALVLCSNVMLSHQILDPCKKQKRWGIFWYNKKKINTTCIFDSKIFPTDKITKLPLNLSSITRAQIWKLLQTMTAESCLIRHYIFSICYITHASFCLITTTNYHGETVCYRLNAWCQIKHQSTERIITITIHI